MVSIPVQPGGPALKIYGVSLLENWIYSILSKSSTICESHQEIGSKNCLEIEEVSTAFELMINIAFALHGPTPVLTKLKSWIIISSERRFL